MGTADQLLELMFSWIEQRERCAEQLMKLARELESLREKCNFSESVGSGMSLVGAAGLFGAGVATVLTAGAAAPLLAAELLALGAGVGVAVSVVTKITEHFLSSHTLKTAQEIEQKGNEIAERIPKLFQQLKEKVRKVYNILDPDELDRCVVAKILGAVAGRQIDIAAAGLGLDHINSDPELIIKVLGIMEVFTLTSTLHGEELRSLIARGVKQLIKKMSKTAFKTAFKGGAMVVGGAVGMSFALHEFINNWKELIAKNHVTEASQSLRDTADAILQMTRILRGQFHDVKRTLKRQEEEETLKKKQVEEEKLRKKQEEEEQLRKKQVEEQLRRTSRRTAQE
ncbi:uncharacterized protein LOC116698792 [Etheostoma spectabile]|uniref:uncharacterized protein LOC116698792 n=1 Tax=Etheostoma spectabile TaxID=54343 RepID=UPI0013AF7DFD|nr:uncharacterized protein LOC116698792 [Etheostoma spectabile]XP_032386874.1 uncharacterized protein LOC116698792 [Etheostoma spectabile]